MVPSAVSIEGLAEPLGDSSAASPVEHTTTERAVAATAMRVRIGHCMRVANRSRRAMILPC